MQRRKRGELEVSAQSWLIASLSCFVILMLSIILELFWYHFRIKREAKRISALEVWKTQIESLVSTVNIRAFDFSDRPVEVKATKKTVPAFDRHGNSLPNNWRVTISGPGNNNYYDDVCIIFVDLQGPEPLVRMCRANLPGKDIVFKRPCVCP